MNRPLIVAISLICAVPLYAQGQQQVIKLKADAQKVASIISGDKAKTQTHCQIANLGEQMHQALKEKDKKKFEELRQRIDEAEKHACSLMRTGRVEPTEYRDDFLSIELVHVLKGLEQREVFGTQFDTMSFAQHATTIIFCILGPRTGASRC